MNRNSKTCRFIIASKEPFHFTECTSIFVSQMYSKWKLIETVVYGSSLKSSHFTHQLKYFHPTVKDS